MVSERRDGIVKLEKYDGQMQDFNGQKETRRSYGVLTELYLFDDW